MPTDRDIPTRVTVLEHGVSELKTSFEGHRSESRQGFSEVKGAIDRLVGDVANRANPVNWFGVIGAIAGTVMIVGSVFALAEWRVNNANAPIVAVHQEVRDALKKANDDIVELRIKSALEFEAHARAKMEMDARIRARVEREARDGVSAK